MDKDNKEWLDYVDKKKDVINPIISPEDDSNKYDDFLICIFCMVFVVGIILIVLTVEGAI